jgi:hypothetical protein
LTQQARLPDVSPVGPDGRTAHLDLTLGDRPAGQLARTPFELSGWLLLCSHLYVFKKKFHTVWIFLNIGFPYKWAN